MEKGNIFNINHWSTVLRLHMNIPMFIWNSLFENDETPKVRINHQQLFDNLIWPPSVDDSLHKDLLKQFLTWSFELKWQQENVMISQFVAVHRIFTYMWVNCSVTSPRRKGFGKSSKSDVLTFSGIWSLVKCDEIHRRSTGVEVAELPTLKEMQAWWPEMCLWDEEGVGRTHEQLILIWLILLMIMMMIMMLMMMLMLILMMIMMMIINSNIIKVEHV